MKPTLSWLGLIFGTLSVVMLIKHGFEVNFAASLEIVVDFYERAMQLLFGWAEPWLASAIARLAAPFGWDDVRLYPHWKHVFILTWLYFGASIATVSQIGPEPEHRTIAVGALIWGFVLALAAGVIAGTISVEAQSPGTSALIAAPSLVAVLLYQLGFRWLYARSFGKGYFRVSTAAELFQIAAGGVALLLVATQFERTSVAPMFGNLPIVTLGALVVALALYWMWRGISFQPRAGYGSSSAAWRLGRRMLFVLLAAITFLATNAGLQLAGL